MSRRAPSRDLWLSLLDETGRYFYFSHPDASTDPDYHRARDNAVHLIDFAEESVELWFYELDEPHIVQALVRARSRGVQILLTGSPDQEYPLLEQSGFIIPRRAKTGLQHAKCMIVDHALLFSGSGNFTTSDMFHNNNAFFHLPLSRAPADRLAAMLGNEESGILFADLPFNGRVLASPEHGKLIQSLIVQNILRAKYRIRYLIFSHTDPVITDALFLKAKSGVLVEGIHDDPYSRGAFSGDSEAAIMNGHLGYSPSLLYLEGNRSDFLVAPGVSHGGHLHHKTILIDDQIVLTGSYNWSMSARDDNLELFYLFDNPAVAATFADEFDRIRERSLASARPPFVEELSGIPLRIDPATGEFDLREGGHHRWTLFSGEGAWFRARHYEADGPGILSPDSLRSSSAGLFQGPGYLLPEDGDGETPSHYQYDFRSTAEGSPSARLPCSDGTPCKPLEGGRVSFASGWIWIASPAPLASIRIWGRTGMGSELPLTQSGADFYGFTPPGTSPGDSIAFFRTMTGESLFACIRTGTAFSGPPLRFLEAVEWRQMDRPRCLQDE